MSQEDQQNLALRQPPKDQIEVDIALVRQQPTFTKAISLCINCGGFEYDNEVYMALKIDPGHWTRIMNGSAHFPVDKLEELMDLCDNEVPLIWLADRRGKEVKPRLSAVEAELEAANKRTDEAELKLKHYKEFAGVGSGA